MVLCRGQHSGILALTSEVPLLSQLRKWSKKLAQCGGPGRPPNPFSRASEEPTINIPIRARERATIKRFFSSMNRLPGRTRTMDKIITSFSSPWKVSTVETLIVSKFTGPSGRYTGRSLAVRKLRMMRFFWPLYGVITVIQAAGVPQKRNHLHNATTALASVSLHADSPAMGRLSLLSGISQKNKLDCIPGTPARLRGLHTALCRRNFAWLSDTDLVEWGR